MNDNFVLFYVLEVRIRMYDGVGEFKANKCYQQISVNQISLE